MTITDHWHELVTAALLGTDRRDPPDPPAGPLAETVDDALAPTPSARMLTTVGACVAVRRAGLRPRPAAPPLAPPEPDHRPTIPAAAARRWRSIVSEWPVLEDEWLDVAERAGWGLSPDVLVGLLRRHRTDAARTARVLRLGGPVATWLLEHQPALRPPAGRRPAPADAGVPALAVPPALAPLVTAGPEAVVTAVAGNLVDGILGPMHRAVLVNFVARMRADGLDALAAALAGAAVPTVVAGLAGSLADLAATRRQMLRELEP